MGERLSVHGVQYLLTKHRMAACKVCPSLKEKRVTVLAIPSKDFEPHWQDEKDWLCIVEFLPVDNPEARLFGAARSRTGGRQRPFRVISNFERLLQDAPSGRSGT
jgi:hypothetical protein